MESETSETMSREGGSPQSHISNVSRTQGVDIVKYFTVNMSEAPRFEGVFGQIPEEVAIKRKWVHQLALVLHG